MWDVCFHSHLVCSNVPLQSLLLRLDRLDHILGNTSKDFKQKRIIEAITKAAECYSFHLLSYYTYYYVTFTTILHLLSYYIHFSPLG